MSTNQDMVTINQYDFQEKALELAQQYFDLENSDTAKSGMFGYVTELFAHESKQNMFYSYQIYKEFFFNTARFYSTLFNVAVDNGIDIPSAKPSRGIFNVFLNKTDLGFVEGNNIEQIITITKEEMTLSIEGLPFIIAHDIVIVKDVNDNYTANYDVSQSNRVISEDIFDEVSANPFIFAFSQVINNVDYLALNVIGYQLERVYDENRVSGVNAYDRLIFPFSYVDSLYNFNVEYIPSNSNTVTVLPRYLSEESAPSTEIEFCLYEPVADDEILVSFPYGGANGFTPAYNSRVNIEIFTTQGTVGNIQFTGDVDVNFETLNIDALATLDNDNGGAYGGKDEPTLLELKRYIFDYIRKVHQLATDEDLESYFSSLTSDLIDANLVVAFRKVRDDIIARQFAGYVLLKDNNGESIQTTTADYLSIAIDSENTGVDPNTGYEQYVLYPGIGFGGTSETYGWLYDESAVSGDQFKNFLYIKTLTDNTYPTASIVNNVFNNDNIPFSYSYVKTGTEVYLEDFKIFCDPLAFTNDERYTELSLKVMKDEVAQDNSNIVVVLAPYYENFLEENFSDNLIVMGYDVSTESFRTQFNYSYDKDYDNAQDFSITTGESYEYMKFSVGDEQTDPSQGILLDGNSNQYQKLKNKTQFSVFVFDTSVAPSYDPETKIETYIQTLLTGSSIEGLLASKELQVVSRTRSTGVKVFENYNDVSFIRCISDNDVGSTFNPLGSFWSGVPLIKSELYTNTEYNTIFMNKYKGFMTILKENLGRFTNNTKVAARLFNNAGYTNNIQDGVINAALSVEIDLHVRKDVILSKENEITTVIQQFIEEFNTSSNGVIYTSNLITRLESEFSDYIASINELRFYNFIDGVQVGLDGYIRRKTSVSQVEIPEFLTIGINSIDFNENIISKAVTFNYLNITEV